MNGVTVAEDGYDTYTLALNGKVFSVPVQPPKADGAYFLGYYTDPTGGSRIFKGDGTNDALSVGGSMLYAHWAPKTGVMLNDQELADPNFMVEGAGYDVQTGVLTLSGGTDYKFAGNAVEGILKQVQVTGGANIELNGLAWESQENKSVFYVSATNADVRLKLTGENCVRSTVNGSAFEVVSGAKLIVSGDGKLKGSVGLTGADDLGGRAVYCNGGTVVWESGTLADYYAAEAGGGFYVGGGSLTFKGGCVTNCLSKNGGGVYVADGSFSQTGGVLTGCQASSNGGGVYVAGGEATLTDGTVAGNEAAQHGGGIAVVKGLFTMTGGTVSGNRMTGAAGAGAGLAFGGNQSAKAVLSGGTVTGNESLQYGGGVAVGGNAEVSIEGDFAIEGNVAGSDGGGLYLNCSTNVMLSGLAKITNNVSTAGSGGGVAVQGGTFVMTDGSVAGNTAAKRGGAWQVGGGAMAKVLVRDGVVSGNRADGGGNVLATTAGNAHGAVEGGVFTDNGEAGNLFLAVGGGSMPTVKGGVFDVDLSGLACLADYTSCEMIWHTEAARWAVGMGLTADALGFTEGTLMFDPTLRRYVDEGVRAGDGAILNKNVDEENPTWSFVLNTGHCHCHCGEAECRIPNDVERCWKPWGGPADTLPVRAGHWYLTNDVTLAAEWAAPANVALCLNGHSVSNANGRVVTPSSGRLIITDCQETPGTITGNVAGQDGACVYVKSGATFTLARATLTGTGANKGGAVYVCQGGRFDMVTGSIRGCSASVGGGVASSGDFTLQGGEICFNRTDANGNGVWADNGRLTVTGGSIHGNSDSASGNGGGGVHLCGNVTATISGGSITNNATAGNGGGILFEGTTLEITGTALIANNESTSSHGGGVAVLGGTLTMTGGTVSGNRSSSGGGVYVSAEADEATISDGLVANNVVTNDIGGGVLVCDGRRLIISGGTFAGNSCGDRQGSAVAVRCDGATVTVRGGTFSNNVTSAGALYAGTNATLAVKGGVFEGNFAGGDLVQTQGGTAVVTGGFFDTDAVGCVASGFSPQALTYTEDPMWYVIARADDPNRLVACVDEGVTNGVVRGAFAFNPLMPLYRERGFKLANGHVLTMTSADTFEVAESDHFHKICCDATCTSHATRGWAEWAQDDALPPYAGFYFLTKDVTLTEEWCPMKGTFLCLNGHTVTRPDGRAILLTEGVRLAITDCARTPGTITGCNANGACVYVGTNAVFELAGATLTGTGASKGGAVYVSQGGRFDMFGGSLEGSSALMGGGVYAEKASTITLSGGVIANCQATSGGGLRSRGEFRLTGGEICFNKSSGGGNGVWMDGYGRLEMTGGSVHGNEDSEPGGTAGGGGFAFRGDATATISGGSITNNATGGPGGGIRFAGASLEISGTALIADNTAQHSDGVSVEKGSLTVAGGMTAGLGAADGDVSAVGGTVSNLVVSGGAVTLCGGVFYGVTNETSAVTTLVYGGLFDALETNDFLRCADGFTRTNVVTRPGSALASMTLVASNGTVVARNGYLAEGTYAFNPLSEEYAAAGVEVAVGISVAIDESSEPTLYTLWHADTLIVNGDFENGWCLPEVAGTNDISVARVNCWTGKNGATVFGKDFADWGDLGVYSNSYALCLAPGASAEQAFAVPKTGRYLLTMRLSGRAGARLRLSYGAKVSELGAADMKFGQVRLEGILLAGDGRFVMQNTGTGLLAVDAILLVPTEDDEPEEKRGRRIRNGSFESGVSLPPEDGSRAIGETAPADWWAASPGAGIYGGRAPGFDAGVTDGDYGLYLNAGASVTQAVECSLSEAADIEVVSTGRWYAVSFDTALKSVGGGERTVRFLLNGKAFAAVYPAEDGSWSSTKTLVFFPKGANTLTISNDVASAGTVLVDNVVCLPYLHTPDEYLYNNRFTYGSALPGYGACDYVQPRGRVTLSCWECEGAVGLFEKHCTEKTLAGVRHGDHALFAEGRSLFGQSFNVPSAGEYRLSFILAARATARNPDYWPSVVVSVDEIVVGTNRATSCTAYDSCCHRFHLEPGSHTVTFEVFASERQAAIVDELHLRLPDESSLDFDVTGVRPNLRLIPHAATAELNVLGAEILYEDAPLGELTFDDFRTDGTNDFYRLEPHARAYTHPVIRCDEPIRSEGGFTLALAGVAGTKDGPVAVCDVRRDASSPSQLLIVENAHGGRAIRVVCCELDDTGLVIKSTNANETVWTTNLVQRNAKASYVISCLDNILSVGVNGKTYHRASSPMPATFEFSRLRLGALPEEISQADLTSRVSPSFAVSDFRAYDHALNDDQASALAHAMAGDTVVVTAFDPVANEDVRSETLRVGGLYGEIAAYRPIRRGCKFLGWTLEADGSGREVTALTEVTVASDHRLYANWSNVTYRVTYDFRGYPGTTNVTYEIQAGERYAPPTGFVVEGVPFYGWTNSLGNAVTSADAFPSDGRYRDETLVADYDPVYASVTFDPHNGAAPRVVGEVELGTPVVEVVPTPAPVRNGYSFADWWSDESGGERLTGETLFLNPLGETWHAHWLGNWQTSTWTCAGCVVGSFTTQSRTGEAFALPSAGDEPIVPVSTNANERFYGWGWYDDPFVPTNAVMLARYDYATGRWETNETVVTEIGGKQFEAFWWRACPLDVNCDGALLATNVTFLFAGEDYGAWMPLPTPVCEGFTFQGWRLNSKDGEPVVSVSVVHEPLPTKLVGTWAACLVIATLEANGGVNVSGDALEVRYGEPYGELPVPIRPGYAFTGWRYGHADGTAVTPETTVWTMENHTLYATWTEASYTVSYRLGTKSPGSFTQYYGDPWPTLYEPTAAELAEEFGKDVEFRGWCLAGTEEIVRAGETAHIVSDTNLVASVKGVTCTLSLNPNNGILTEENRTVEVAYGGTLGTLPVPIRVGCQFDGWFMANGTQVVSGQVWQLTGRTDLYAKWHGTTPIQVTFVGGAAYAPYVTNNYYLAAMPVPPAVVSPRSDGGVFCGWWLGDVMVYDADGKPVGGVTEFPYQTSVSFVARWVAAQDAFAGALALTDEGYMIFDLEGTDEDGEPDHDGEGVLRATHWYTFKGTSGANVRLTFTDLSAHADEPAAALVLYRGTSFADLERVAQSVSYDEVTLAVEATLPADGTYYVAVAQDPDYAALTGYELTAEGAGPAVWKSKWTSPAKMPGATDENRVYNALVHDGFSSEVATRLSSPTNAYTAFRTWAHAGEEGEEVPPEDLYNQTNVILAAAYDRLPVPPDAVLSITDCLMMTNKAGAVSMRLWLVVSGDFTKSGARNASLLNAAVSVKGSSSVVGTYTTGYFDVTVEQVDIANNLVRILATPKEAEPKFFFKGVTY